MLISKNENIRNVSTTEKRPLTAIKLDWLGQMLASMLWAISVFVYGISSTGDILQLCAALAWMAANIAAFVNDTPKKT